MQDNKNEKLIIDLRRKNSSELVEFLNALLSARQVLSKKGIKVKVLKKMPNKLSPPPPACISKF
jgi:hypothetical protein